MSLLGVLLLVGLVFGLYMAWSIGANDVANAMGTSVGSRALTVGQGMAVAGVFEFAGAVMVGAKVSDTVKKNVLDLNQFPDPVLFVVAMLSALLAAAVWLQVASWRGVPVSTTHSIIGGVAGAGVAAIGVGGLHWDKLAYIGVSWVLSPFIGAVVAFVLFRVVSRVIINSKRPRVNVRRYAPLLVGLVIEVLFLSLLYKGLKNLHLDWPLGQALAAATGLAVVGILVTMVVVRRVKIGSGTSKFKYVERCFRWLQVMTACYVAFAHGANDVGNAVGPLAGIYTVWSTGELTGQVGVPLWVLALGGLGIVVGLATYGYKVMETVGTKITALVPSRGFAAEFAAATTVLICSKLGLPISTTHTLVGAVIGVGMARGFAALEMRVVRSIVSAWLITLPVSFILAAVICLVMQMVV
ncbi:MAG: inorganic phosphate transporter [Acidobacteriota bacterium]